MVVGFGVFFAYRRIKHLPLTHLPEKEKTPGAQNPN
jgi:hypothetical protein